MYFLALLKELEEDANFATRMKPTRLANLLPPPHLQDGFFILKQKIKIGCQHGKVENS